MNQILVVNNNINYTKNLLIKNKNTPKRVFLYETKS
jgi:hypothetical protein